MLTLHVYVYIDKLAYMPCLTLIVSYFLFLRELNNIYQSHWLVKLFILLFSISSLSLTDQLGIASIENKIRENRLRWYGYVFKSPMDVVVRRSK